MPDTAPAETFVVVRNHEEQYSVWWADRELPAGWDAVGEPASRDACLDRIEELWTDMRPLSLRRWLETVDA
ncbi:MAG TPA: MbtH family NRPS accessory protein [Solirubrobacteraceae bacterium]|jgi:MbtH protein|nr:MbtH family NRPS accessory protein [Solirubrobacteraceae bacterium]